jgi:dimethylhistidine N-methyltransferase
MSMKTATENTVPRNAVSMMNAYQSTTLLPDSISATEPSWLSSQGFLEDVIAGLKKSPKSIPCKYLYDHHGSRLFEAICELDDYYPTRAELNIMRKFGPSMAQHIGRRVVLVELGSGSSLKTRFLLEHLQEPVAYLPVDISASHLHLTATKLRMEYPELEVRPIVSDFTELLQLPTSFQDHRVCTYFPGSTIGNLEPDEAIALLRRVAQLGRHPSGLLIGFDLQKDPGILHRAYNDSEGVTAEFSLNLLHRINRELHANFNHAHYRHLAFYNPLQGRVEIYIQSLCDQTVVIAGERWRFDKNERILTEYSHKYTVKSFSELSEHAGFSMEHVWIDDEELFAVAYLIAKGKG